MIYFSDFAAAAAPGFSSGNVTQAVGDFLGPTVTCTLPVLNHLGGALAVGDALYVITAGSFATNLLSGYTDLNNETGSFWNGRLMKKVLTSGDISAGSVTVTFAGSHAAWVCLVAMSGDPTLRNQSVHRNGTSSATPSQTTTGTAPVAGDLVVHFSSCRGNITLITASHGTAILATATMTGNGAARIFSETLGSSGHFSTTWTYNNSGQVHYLGSLTFAP